MPYVWNRAPRKGLNNIDTGFIDVHTHYVPHGWPDLGTTAEPMPTLRIDTERQATIMMGSKEFRTIQDNCWNAEARIAEMDADSVDMQVLLPTPAFFSYGNSAAQAVRISALFNDTALEISSAAPSRLLPFCQIPLQDTDAACRELERSIANGHRGVEIGNHVGDFDLDSEGIVTFLQHAASLDVPVFVHPWDMPHSPRLGRWMAQWLAGMPAETHLSILAMILGGAFDKLPTTLKICFAHGGGSFAFWVGRMDNAWHRRHDIIGTSAHPPSHYLGRFYTDSVVFDHRALTLLIDTIGIDRVLLGSDYPYPLGERPVGAVVQSTPSLKDHERHAILRGNAETFLGLFNCTSADPRA